MKASEVINRLKDVLLSSTETEEVAKTTTKEDVELKEQAPEVQNENVSEESSSDKNIDNSTSSEDIREINYSADEVTSDSKEEIKSEELEEEPQEEIVEEKSPEYATKDEVAEVRAMVEKLRGMIETKDEAYAEVPQELSSEESTEPLSHSPENEVSEKLGVRYATNANTNTTYSRVLNAISNN
tara:strand:- start:207 stop:758 length:552 start_codon:yes stop_codon:yes gene_type:complete